MKTKFRVFLKEEVDDFDSPFGEKKLIDKLLCEVNTHEEALTYLEETSKVGIEYLIKTIYYKEDKNEQNNSK